jgi:hypothetical protein
MLTGLDILLARMKTNPEEFLKDDHVPYEGESFGGKWSDLVNYAWRIATEEERQMLEDARREFYRDDFNERVMKRLAGEEVKQELSPYIVKQGGGFAVSAGGTGGSGSAMSMLGQQGAQQARTNSLQVTGSGGAGVQGVMQGGYGQAQVRQEGAAIGIDSSFWGGITKSLGGR